VIRPGVTGLLVQAGDAAALAESILQTILSPAPAAERAANGRRLIERTYSSAAMARNYLTLYERALCSRTKLYAAATERAKSA